MYGTDASERLKNLESIHKEGIKIYTRYFKISSIEALHVEANDHLGKGKGTLWKKRKVHNYEENEKATRPPDMNFRNLEWRYM